MMSVRTAIWATFGALLLVALILAPSAAAVTIDWVTIGNPGNLADPLTGYGSVSDSYRISKTEVTNAQYAEFLNAVATTSDPDGLYDENMNSGFGGITFSFPGGNLTYQAIAGRADMPVNFVGFYDALRFANWLHNGQPTGVPDNTTTEDGAYTITAQGIANNSIARNADVLVFLPSEDEWFKSAYYDAVTTSYFNYPTSSNVQSICSTPTSSPNSANCNIAVMDFTDVGSYPGSASPSGTLDQAGNAWEWNEGIGSVGTRVRRGGSFNEPLVLGLNRTERSWVPTADSFLNLGFRVASVPEPSSGLLVTLGLLAIAAMRPKDSDRT